MKQWRGRLRKSAIATPFCKFCFKPIGEDSFLSGFLGDSTLCPDCYREMKPEWFKWKEGNVPCTALYFYNHTIRTMLYQFKGCGDYELKDAFFAYPRYLLRTIYRGYTIVPAPSSRSHNEKRGFNQVVAMCECLGLPLLDCLEKTVDAKQSDLSAKERAKIGKYLIYRGPKSLSKRKILLVDDVFTTGSTARGCLKLLAAHHPRKLAFLTMAKTLPK